MYIYSSSDANLLPGVQYIFYIRAWYDVDTYAVYQSNVIQTVPRPPEISKSHKVKEVINADSLADLDFITSTSGIYVTWANVFRDNNAPIVSFAVSLGTFFGGSDVIQMEVSGSVTSVRVNVTLVEDQPYHTTVTSQNEAGLFSSAMSDGFMVYMHVL